MNRFSLLLVTSYQRDKEGRGGEGRAGEGRGQISLGLVGAKHKERSNIKFTLSYRNKSALNFKCVHAFVRCKCACVCIYACALMCVHSCVYVSRGHLWLSFFGFYPSFVLKQGLFLAWPGLALTNPVSPSEPVSTSPLRRPSQKTYSAED